MLTLSPTLRARKLVCCRVNGMIATENRAGSAFIDGQADAVHRDRSFGHQQTRRELAGTRNLKTGKFAFFFDRRDRADAIDMAGHQMAAQPFLRVAWAARD